MNNNQLTILVATLLGVSILVCTIYLRQEVELRCDGTNFISISELKAE